jgi:aspartokinase-like uncharacterized kinase
MQRDVHIIKVGGSLFDLPQLPQRLGEVIAASDASCQLIVTGGGRSADVVRQWDTLHHVGEEACHWIALRAMQFNAYLLQSVLTNAMLVSDPAQLQSGAVHLLDPILWLKREESQGIHIPHVWQYTSDSVAAHLATQLCASRLTLCKSTLPQQECGRSCAAGLGIVDDYFPAVAADIEYVELINLRDEKLCSMMLLE